MNANFSAAIIYNVDSNKVLTPLQSNQVKEQNVNYNWEKQNFYVLYS